MPTRSSLPSRESKWSAGVFSALLCIALAVAVWSPATLASPPYIVLQTLFRHFMYPLLTGESSEQPFPHAAGIYFIIVTPAVIGLVIVLYRRLMKAVPPGTYIGRATKVFGLMVLAMYVLNSGVQGGLGIPLALGYAGLLVFVWCEAQQLEWARRIVAGVVWVGLGFLVSSGAIVPLVQGETRFDLQRLHGIYGYLWLSAVGAYLIGHITHYEAKRETAARNWGYLAAAILSAAVLTGVARLHAGGETSSSGLWPHVLTAAAAGIAMAVHIGRSWQKRGLVVQRGPGYGSGIFLLGCMGVGLALPALPIVFGGGGWADTPPTVAGGAALLASPGMGVTASGPGDSAIPVALVSIRESAISCGKNGGCHVDTQTQWARSAHRFSANAAYRQTVRLLIQEAGIERARLCAGCHDPVPLLTGQIVEGSNYPFEESEGVTCVVCHSMQPGVEAKNGHYTVAPSSVFNGSIKDPFSAYMMIELYRHEHRADFLDDALTDNTMCAPCHNLTSEHLVLRRTYDEWREGPFGPGSPNAKACTGCHMPLVGETYLGFFKLHDHRMPASNVALAGPRAESPETEAAFIAAALDLQIAIARRPDGFDVSARLSNENGGHVFPTAPRDLLDYWFEVQFEGNGVDPAWRRLDAAGLFPEKLISDEGHVLERHEIWRAVERQGPEGIAPGQSHAYSFPLPDPPRGVERVTVRLMHRRYRDAFLSFLEPDTGGLYTAPIEVLRRTTDWPSDARIAGR